jgi:hypothetical protein
MTPIQEKFEELNRFMKNWQAEVAQMLGSPMIEGHSIGISFQPELELSGMPVAEKFPEGLYRTLDNHITVEVTDQNVALGLVMFQIVNIVGTDVSTLPTLQTGMHVNLFKHLFYEKTC